MKIEIDVNGKTAPTDYSWRIGIGNDHAFQVLRKDVCEHLKLAHDELGFQYVRFHGIFDDDMRILQTFADVKGFAALPQAAAIKELNFKRVAVCLDNVLACGLKPFIELSFMPNALASGKVQGLAYVNNITMPKDLGEWSEFIRSFIRFAIGRYGKDEVESWCFEVWNEPDLPIFFAGTQEDYFKLYAATVTAIKSVDAQLKVGGPATSACRWIKEFLDFCEKNELPCDFVSTHHYPGDAFGNIVSDRAPEFLRKTMEDAVKNATDLGDTITELFYDPSVSRQWKKGTFVNMDVQAKQEAGDKPFFITEWNCSATYSAPVHDEKNSAAFVVKSALDADGKTDGYMFWCCSDVFEETYDLGKPFHGSFGIINNDGIPKPNFWAFKMLSEVYPNRLELPVTNADVEYAVFKDENKTQILVYAQDFDAEKFECHEIVIRLNQFYKKVTKKVIDDTHCNPKAEWQKLGSPDLLTPLQVENIKERTRLVAENQEFESIDGDTVINLNLRTNDVVFLELE